MTYPVEGGTWYGADTIETEGGQRYDVINPDPALISLNDIAYSLSTQNRFGGHANPFWSVAQHSCFVVDILIGQGYGYADLDLLQGALLHDSPEAFLLDIPRPTKPHYGEAYRKLTRISEEALGERFNIDPSVFSDPVIKQADHIALIHEGHRVMKHGPPQEEIDRAPLPATVVLPPPLSMDLARSSFIGWARILEIV